MASTPTQLDQYRLLGNSALRVSPLCLGTMTFGTEWGWGADFEASQEVFNAYAEKGGNFIDTADYYTGGTSEDFVGNLIDGRRDDFVLATKYSLNTSPKNPNTGGNHRRNLIRSVEDSLQRLGTDYIDLYWLHIWDYRSQIEDVMRALDDLVRQGKILHIGFSDTPAWVVSEGQAIAKLRGWTPISAIQVQYNLVERTSEADMLPMAKHHDITPLSWSPLAGGVLTGKYSREDLKESQDNDSTSRKKSLKSLGQLNEKNLKIADKVVEIAKEIGRSPSQVALNWIISQPSQPIAIVGSRKLSHLEDNIQALEFSLAPKQIEQLNEASQFAPPFPHNFASPALINSVVDGEAAIESKL